MRSKQSGFTLVEIAIVLVIIGLLLGGVLKGQELINSAKVKNMINDFRSTSTFVFAYQDRFRALPGDDTRAVANVAAAAPATTPAGTLGNARINGVWNSLTATDESYLFWEQVRRAGLATGDPTPVAAPAAADLYNPRNADGGRLGITGDPVIAAAGAWTANFYICSSGIQGRFARQIDTTIDDGNTAQGTVRVLTAAAKVAGTAVTAANAGEQAAGVVNTVSLEPIDDATLFTVCVAY
jgi:prepilin-type N-terminal cleavage/methylation domain-containing protein